MCTQVIPFDPTQDSPAFLANVPAKWAVYLLTDANDLPFQLLCVKNLRSSLATRLAEHPADEKTRSIPYRQVVRNIHYLRVDSELEADWRYQTLLQQLFPQAYRLMLADREFWFISTDLAKPLPRFIATNQPLTGPADSTFGPIGNKHSAGKCVELIQDAFDLCRYYSILTQTPAGQACAYKQMQKCPAPCDGSISMPMYQQMIQSAAGFLADPHPFITQHEQRMQAAAGTLQFEAAGKIKAFVQQLQSLTANHFKNIVPLPQLQFAAILRGPSARQIKLMLLSPREVRLIGEYGPDDTDDALVQLATPPAFPPESPANPPDADAPARLALICQHLIYPGRHGVLIPMHDLSTSTIHAARQTLARRKPDPDTGEGLVQETRQ